MRNIILTTTLAIFGLSLNNAHAFEAYTGYNAADDFAPSSQHNMPPPRIKRQLGRSDAGSITSSTGNERVTSGYSAAGELHSDEQSSTQRNGVKRGYSAANDFGASY